MPGWSTRTRSAAEQPARSGAASPARSEEPMPRRPVLVHHDGVGTGDVDHGGAEHHEDRVAATRPQHPYRPVDQPLAVELGQRLGAAEPACRTRRRAPARPRGPTGATRRGRPHRLRAHGCRLSAVDGSAMSPDRLAVDRAVGRGEPGAGAAPVRRRRSRPRSTPRSPPGCAHRGPGRSGEASRASSSSVRPASRSRASRSSWVRRLPIAPTYAAGVRSATSSSGTSNFGSWVSTQITVRSSTAGRRPRYSVRPLDDDLVGLGEALGGGEHRPRVAHRHVVAEEAADPGDRGGEVDGAEDQHPRRRRERLHEHGQLVAAALAVGAVVQEPGAAGLEHAARVVGDGVVEPRRPERARPRGPATPCAWPPIRPGPSTTVATATGSRSRTEAATAGSSGQVCSRHRLDEDVEDPAAGQADGERVVVGDAVPLQDRPPGRDDLLGQVVDRALDAAAGDAADRLAVRPTTAIAAPAGRGADCQVRTTVASPNGRPDPYSRTTSSMTSRTAHSPASRQQLREVLERGQAVPGHEVVDVRQRRAHPGGQRLEAGSRPGAG